MRNERKDYDIYITKTRIFERDNYVCRICNSSILSKGSAQLAHRINRSKMNIKKYGSEIINHDNNLYSVCSLKCNAKVDIGCNTELEKEIVEGIRNEMQ